MAHSRIVHIGSHGHNTKFIWNGVMDTCGLQMYFHLMQHLVLETDPEEVWSLKAYHCPYAMCVGLKLELNNKLLECPDQVHLKVHNMAQGSKFGWPCHLCNLLILEMPFFTVVSHYLWRNWLLSEPTFTYKVWPHIWSFGVSHDSTFEWNWIKIEIKLDLELKIQFDHGDAAGKPSQIEFSIPNPIWFQF